MEADALEQMFALKTNTHNDHVIRAIRLIELATEMFGAICDFSDDLPDEVLSAADDFYSYLTEVAGD